MLERYFRARTRTVEHAQDLVQDVLLAAVRNIESFRGECPLDSWVLRIGANHLKNYINRTLGKHTHESLDDIVERVSDDLQHNAPRALPQDEVIEEVIAQRFRQLAKQACNATELTVVSAHAAGESFEEISLLLHLNPTTVRSHWLRARGKLLALCYLESPELWVAASWFAN